MLGMRDIHLSHICAEPNVGPDGSPPVVRSRMPAVAFLGLGHMGTPMAHRVVAAGLDVVVWNRTRDRTAPLVSAGARAAGTPAEAAGGADGGMTTLADPAAGEAARCGPVGGGGGAGARG